MESPTYNFVGLESPTYNFVRLESLTDEDRTEISRDAFLDTIHRENIGVGVHYLSLAEHPYYQKRMGWEPDMWPAARDIGRQTVSLPIGPGLSDVDVEDVIAAVRRVLGDT